MTAQQPEALRLAADLEEGNFLLSQERNATAHTLRTLHARVQELERWQDDVRSNSPLLARLERAEQRVRELEAKQDRAPLSEDDALDIAKEHACGALYRDLVDVVRATERAHGIQEKQG